MKRNAHAWIASTVVTLVCLWTSLTTAQADLVDFEFDMRDNQFLYSISTPTNHLTFEVDEGHAPTIARVGGPITAFVPNDTPVGGNPGEYFLSNGSASVRGQYFIVFANPISNLSLDLYDYANTTGQGRLSLFENADFTGLVGLDEFAPLDLDGGVIETSAEVAEGFVARSASITFTVGDPGNGIDNISFSTVPEPAFPGVAGALAMVAVWWRRRRSNTREN